MDAALARAAQRTPEVATVVDVGASDGRWTRLAMNHYPDAQFLLIEAQEEHKPALKEFCDRCANAQYILAAAGDNPCTVNFLAGNPYFETEH